MDTVGEGEGGTNWESSIDIYIMCKINLFLLNYNLQCCIKKQRHYFVNKGPSSQGYGFSSSLVWMWELDCEESWAPKNWCFWTVVLEKILKEISSGCSLEGLMLKLKLQYFGHLMRRADSLRKILMLGGIRGRRKRGRQRMRWLDGQWTWVWVNSGS